MTTLLTTLMLAAGADPLAVADAKPAPELSALFERRDGWIGGDGAYSVALGPRRVLWLFSDTWVGKVRDGKRTDVTMVNNTAAVQDGIGGGAKVEFFIRTGADGKPAALITPADGRGWFWLQAGALANGRLTLFLGQFEKTGDRSVFGFRQVGTWLGVVANPHDPPTAWRVEQKKLPFGTFTAGRDVCFGATVLAEGDDLYVYGIDDVARDKARHKHLIVAKVPLRAVDEFTAWRFYHDGQWVADTAAATRVAEGVANEVSVSVLPGPRRRYALVYTENGLSDRILARTADTPAGPWSAPSLLYHCPEMARDKNVFSYAAKAHPALAAGDELIITYVVSPYEFGQMVADARLYWPRFVRVKLATVPN
jgi:Domain of unknown function (DUF4185)